MDYEDYRAELQVALDTRNATDPPDIWAPAILANIRHGCVKARLSGPEGRAVSTALDLHEVYLVSTDGSHAMLFREGRCTRCRQLARSRMGRLVKTTDRPPLYGRVARS